jgi:hypothetical protein
MFTESRYEIIGNSKTAERLERHDQRTGEIPLSKADVFSWLARHFGPQDPLRNPETNRLVSEWLIKTGYKSSPPPGGTSLIPMRSR